MNNLFIFNHEEIENNRYQITDELRLQHIHEVLGSQQGDSVRLCLINRGLGIGKFTLLEDQKIEIELLEESSGQAPWINLVVGLSRPPTCKKIMEHGTSLGVSEFHFFKAELSEKSYSTAKIFSPSKYHQLLHLGLSQSGCYYKEPTVALSPGIKFVEKQNFPNKFFLDLEGEHSPLDYDFTMDQNITLAVGPERGWTEKERQYLIDNGFQGIKIADSILRTEIATFAALGQLHLMRQTQHRRKLSSPL
ncbi:MAG: 16S rRNA (uracil(1498)-N(3))-methyltransferase [Halobacteriovoraceae bacterium]|nr:16S rRNA (uracil(1498)-N(3))-methyltransferase [Halobacteriovoraceae bacterium]